MKATHTLIFVLYDGIENSVFQSQVLFPLMQMIEKNDEQEIIVISFEHYKISDQKLIKLIPPHERMHIIICRKMPFFGKVSLLFAAYQFKNFLKKFSGNEIIARGPLAGFIVLHALHALIPKQLNAARYADSPLVTIQARGLCAQEYRYAHKTHWNSFFKKYWHRFIFTQLDHIEEFVFGGPCERDIFPLTIEAVSPALKQYLIEHWHADAVRIVLATRDVPPPIIPEQIALWKLEVRKELGIPSDAVVYCYSGSFKPWQCAQESIDYFLEQYKKDSISFMLVLSQDRELFKRLLEKSNLSQKQYVVMYVSAQKLYRYLSAADFGLLFREPDIINWVSRPTKMLEYQAVGLKIIHNDTIALLAKN